MKNFSIAIVGATGAVGIEILKVLEKRNFPVESIRLLASKRSSGRQIEFKGQKLTVKELKADSFEGCGLAFFSAGGSISKEFAPIAVKNGCVVIDNSSAFRMDPKVPLVVPEVNPTAANNHKGIIANPNCTTIIASVALFPIHQKYQIKRAVIATYQAVSGAGAKAIEELKEQSQAFLDNKETTPQIFRHPIAFNLFSHDSELDEQGYSTEERKIVQETRKIFADDQIQISPTCIRVPTFRAHAEAIHLDLAKPFELAEISALIEKSPGVRLVDNATTNHFPMPLEASNQDDVLVGRLRVDTDLKTGLNLFVCGDQILKGAALNAVQIAEIL